MSIDSDSYPTCALSVQAGLAGVMSLSQTLTAKGGWMLTVTESLFNALPTTDEEPLVVAFASILDQNDLGASRRSEAEFWFRSIFRSVRSAIRYFAFLKELGQEAETENTIAIADSGIRRLTMDQIQQGLLTWTSITDCLPQLVEVDLLSRVSTSMSCLALLSADDSLDEISAALHRLVLIGSTKTIGAADLQARAVGLPIGEQTRLRFQIGQVFQTIELAYQTVNVLRRSRGLNQTAALVQAPLTSIAMHLAASAISDWGFATRALPIPSSNQPINWLGSTIERLNVALEEAGWYGPHQ